MIRCKECLKELHDQEKYCTKCGTYSQEIDDMMKQGKKYDVSVYAKFKLNIIIFAILGFIINGVLNILFSSIYKGMYPDIGLGDVSDKLPSSMTVFSQSNAFLVVSALMLIIYGLTNYKELINMAKKLTKNNLFQSLLFGLISSAIIIVLHYMTSYTKVIPSLYSSFLYDKIDPNKLENSLTVVKTVITMISFFIVQEIVFRKSLIDALEEKTLFSDFTLILVSSLITVAFEFLMFMDFKLLLGSFLLQIIMCTMYLNTNKNLLPNIIIRSIILIIIVII